MQERKHRSMAFSLVEVTVAIGVAAFCLVGIIGLLPVGIESNQAVTEQTAAGSIARAMVADLRSSPSQSGTSRLYGVLMPSPGNPVDSPQAMYVAEDGSRCAEAAGSRYRATLWLTPPAKGGKGATFVRLQVTWPALADPNPAIVPAHFSGSLEILTALTRS